MINLHEILVVNILGKILSIGIPVFLIFILLLKLRIKLSSDKSRKVHFVKWAVIFLTCLSCLFMISIIFLRIQAKKEISSILEAVQDSKKIKVINSVVISDEHKYIESLICDPNIIHKLYLSLSSLQYGKVSCFGMLATTDYITIYVQKKDGSTLCFRIIARYIFEIGEKEAISRYYLADRDYLDKVRGLLGLPLNTPYIDK